jgi:hypothetical protein
MVNTVKPKAKDTPSKPMPKLFAASGNAAAKTALPQPANTSQKVPKNSANNLFMRTPLKTNGMKPKKTK